MTISYGKPIPGTPERIKNLPWADGIAGQIKENGMAVMRIRNDLYSRAGKKITDGLRPLRDHLSVVPRDQVLHFELLVALCKRRDGNGLINSLVSRPSSLRVKFDYDRLIIVGLDMIPLNDYMSGVSPVTMRTRYTRMREAIQFVSGRCYPVLTELFHTIEQADTFYQNIIAAEYEGIVLKPLASPWRSGPMPYQLKKKPIFECELRVVACKKHTRERDWLGALICQSEDGKLEVSINLRGDSKRKMPFSFYRDRVVQVIAEKVIESKSKDKLSLYLPRFDEPMFREDRDTANTLAEIYEEEAASRKEVTLLK